jgi:hypothetical protein
MDVSFHGVFIDLPFLCPVCSSLDRSEVAPVLAFCFDIQRIATCDTYTYHIEEVDCDLLGVIFFPFRRSDTDRIVAFC